MSEFDAIPMPKALEKEIDSTIDEKAFLPILKAGDWVGLECGAVRQTLLGTKDDPKLVVGFGLDTSEHYVFLMGKDASTINLENAVRYAYENLDAMPVTFELYESFDNKLVKAMGEPLSSEIILSVKHMLKIHEVLDAKQLMVSIPKRGRFMAISREAPQQLLNKFACIHNHTWEDDGYDDVPLTDLFFVVENGEIVDVLTWQPS